MMQSKMNTNVVITDRGNEGIRRENVLSNNFKYNITLLCIGWPDISSQINYSTLTKEDFINNNKKT